MRHLVALPLLLGMLLLDLIIVLLCFMIIGIIPLMELNDKNRFPLCLYGWREMGL